MNTSSNLTAVYITVVHLHWQRSMPSWACNSCNSIQTRPAVVPASPDISPRSVSWSCHRGSFAIAASISSFVKGRFDGLSGLVGLVGSQSAAMLSPLVFFRHLSVSTVSKMGLVVSPLLGSPPAPISANEQEVCQQFTGPCNCNRGTPSTSSRYRSYYWVLSL